MRATYKNMVIYRTLGTLFMDIPLKQISLFFSNHLLPLNPLGGIWCLKPQLPHHHVRLLPEPHLM